MCKPVVTTAPPTVIVDLAHEPAVSNNATENATESVVDTQSFSVVEQVIVDNVPVNGSTKESVLEPLPATPTAVEASATVLEMQPQENFTADANTTMSNFTESQSVTEPSPISTTTGVLALVDAVSTDTMGVTEPTINEIVTEASSNTTEAVNSTIPDPVPEIIFPSVVLPADPVPLVTDPPVLTTEPPTTTDLPVNAEPAAAGGAPAVTELPTADQPAQPAVMDPLVHQGAGAAAARRGLGRAALRKPGRRAGLQRGGDCQLSGAGDCAARAPGRGRCGRLGLPAAVARLRAGARGGRAAGRGDVDAGWFARGAQHHHGKQIGRAHV